MIIGRRRSRLVGAIWALVALGFLAGAVLLWIDARRVSFEVPASLVAAVLSWTWWRQRAELDRHGINTRGPLGERRVLWAGVDHVEVRRTSWIRPGIVLHPKGAGAAVPVPASAGLRPRQRNRLLEFLTDLSRQHGFTLLTVNGEVLSGPGVGSSGADRSSGSGPGGGPIFDAGGASQADPDLVQAQGDVVESGSDVHEAVAEPSAGAPDHQPARGAVRTPPWLLDESSPSDA